MFHLTLSASMRAICPQFQGAALCANVVNASASPALWDEINVCCLRLREAYTPDTLKERPGIAATRAAYKAAGKDPSRYRPSCEQLARRVVQGKGLYSIDTLVDLGNLVSISSGYSISMLDADKVAGPAIELGIGRDEEPYEGIGRGTINIAHLPIYRDSLGPFASGTSDSVRTCVGPDTRHLLMLINAYDGDLAGRDNAVALSTNLLTRYASASQICVSYY